MLNIGSILSTTIYLISSSLLYPTLFFLVAGFIFTVIYAGSFCAEWLERARLKHCSAGELPSVIVSKNSADALPHRVKNYIVTLRDILNNQKHISEDQNTQNIQVENLVQESTISWFKSMDRLRIMVRLGPSLGLMGTLIPMGTGLASLGTGDMARLSSDLVIAFTTTVVGLAIGMTAYCIYTVKNRWIQEDIKNMELATELIISELTVRESALMEQGDRMP
ncbi:MAG: MotA/TolQ/ExbB proton channel family protein [Desulfamplus sp.]|nr:MotA/TolQ/ExbB proton channel family protein [Desulfamplus sp.]